jgi:hypothetical protein
MLLVPSLCWYLCCCCQHQKAPMLLLPSRSCCLRSLAAFALLLPIQGRMKDMLLYLKKPGGRRGRRASPEAISY